MQKLDIMRIYNQFNRIHNQFSVVKRKFIYENAGNPLYPAEMHVLTIVSSNPAYTVSDIAEALYISRSAASQIVKKLTIKGFLIKHRSKDNERIVNLIISESGSQAVKYFIDNQDSAFGEMLKEMNILSDKDIETIELFLSTLEKMYEKKLK